MASEDLQHHYTAFKWNEERNELTPLSRLQDKGATTFKTYDETYQSLELDINMLCQSGVIFECRSVRVLRHVSPDIERLADILDLHAMAEKT